MNRHLSGFTDEEIAAEFKARGLTHSGTRRKERVSNPRPMVQATCPRCTEPFSYRQRKHGRARVYCKPCVLPAKNERQRDLRAKARTARTVSCETTPAVAGANLVPDVACGHEADSSRSSSRNPSRV